MYLQRELLCNYRPFKVHIHYYVFGPGYQAVHYSWAALIWAEVHNGHNLWWWMVKSWVQCADFALEPVLFSPVPLVVVHWDSTGWLCAETAVGTSGRVTALEGVGWMILLWRMQTTSVQPLGTYHSFSWGRAVSYESITLNKHFLSHFFFLPHSCLCYKPLIHLMSDRSQKQKL